MLAEPGYRRLGGVLLPQGDRRREISGAEPKTTNQRMELVGAIEALRALERPCDALIHTDSTYVCNGFVRGWVAGWQTNGWLNSAKKPVANKDLWLELAALTTLHRVVWQWVRGHAGVEENERCDKLAVTAREQLRLKLTDGGT